MLRTYVYERTYALLKYDPRLKYPLFYDPLLCWFHLYKHLKVECFELVVPAIFLPYAPTFFIEEYTPRHKINWVIVGIFWNWHFSRALNVSFSSLSNWNEVTCMFEFLSVNGCDHYLADFLNTFDTVSFNI